MPGRRDPLLPPLPRAPLQQQRLRSWCSRRQRHAYRRCHTPPLPKRRRQARASLCPCCRSRSGLPSPASRCVAKSPHCWRSTMSHAVAPTPVENSCPPRLVGAGWRGKPWVAVQCMMTQGGQDSTDELINRHLDRYTGLSPWAWRCVYFFCFCIYSTSQTLAPHCAVRRVVRKYVPAQLDRDAPLCSGIASLIKPWHFERITWMFWSHRAGTYLRTRVMPFRASSHAH